VDGYRRRPSDNIIWIRYDDSDNWVVHSPASAQLHLLTASAHLLWTLVPEHTASSTADLIARLSSAIDRPADASFAQTTAETLAFFDRVGLIEPVTP